MTDTSGTGESAHLKNPSSSSIGDGTPCPPKEPQGSDGLARFSFIRKIFGELDWEKKHRSKKDVTASEVAIILGVHPHKSVFTLFHEKVGNLPHFEGNISTRAGHILEPFIAQLYREETKRFTVDPGAFTMYRSADIPWLWCTPDRFDDDGRVVELKALGAYSRKDWTNKTGPLEYQVQNQIQLYCTGREKGALAGLIATREFFAHDFDRHDRLLKNIIPKLAEFRERCINGDPPPADESHSTTVALKALHPKDKKTDSAVYDDHMEAFMNERKKLKDQMAHMQRDLNLVENKLKNSIGDNIELWANGVKMTYKWQHTYGKYHKAYDSRVLRGPS